jgi:hypothetical protein
MASIYADADLAAGKLGSAAHVGGVQEFCAIQAFAVAAADAAGTIYRVFPDIPSDAIVTELHIMNEAVTGATGALIGIYNSIKFDGVGAIIGSGNQFHTNFDLSSANAIASGFVNAMPAVTIPNREVALWELVSFTQYPYTATGPKPNSFDICLTMANKTTVATGNVVMRLRYVRGV